MLRLPKSCCILIYMNTTKAEVLAADKFACLAADARDEARQNYLDAQQSGASDVTLEELGLMSAYARKVADMAHARFSRLYVAYGKSLKVTMCPTVDAY